MGDYAIIFQILGVLLALFFIFLTVMNFKTWRWLHALTTFAVFCAVGTFMVYAALVIMAAFFSTIMTVLFKVRDRVLVWQQGLIKW